MLTLLPPSSCLAEQLSPHTRCDKPTLTFLFAPLRKPIKITAKESPDYKADEPAPPGMHTPPFLFLPSGVCIHVWICVHATEGNVKS